MAQLQRATWSLVAGALLLSGCSDALDVENVNNPERGQVFAQGRDLETLTGRLYQNVHEATVGPRNAAGTGTELDAIYPQMLTLGLENVSALNNFGMGPRGGIPRGLIDNGRGNNFSAGNRRDFRSLQNAARGAITVLERLADSSFTIGTDAADARAESFAYFSLGTALGNVALVYDSAGVPKVGEDLRGAAPALVPYTEVMTAALAALDTAQLIAASGRFTASIPAEWLTTSAATTIPNYTRIIRSYKARFRAQVARSPEERAAVNWAQVIADATNGITTNFTLQLNPTTGWDYSWLASHFSSAAWHQMTPYIIGMADSSGNYDGWLATPRESRTQEQMLILTRDRRFPAGNTRAAQIANSPQVPTDTLLYFRNRGAGEDTPGPAWGVSFYDYNRWRALRNASRVGAWPTMTAAEIEMLAAEGYIRTGAPASAIPLINKYRTRAGLPVLTAGATEVPGGVSCVPRVPDPAQAFIATKCGDLLEAMKWEKRMETAYAGYGIWYLDGRGWGDLPEGTPIHWPVPWQEKDARVEPFTPVLGGVGRPGGTPPSTTYGFGTGNR